MCQLQKQYDFYRQNKSNLMSQHEGMVLVINDALEVHAFATMAEAYSFGAQQYGFGHFLLQRCTENADKVQVITNITIR